jgi:uncharacterized membrane protein YbhN (UPF0104 family)
VSRRAARAWLLRLVGLALVAWILSGQLHWLDTLRLADGGERTGQVTLEVTGDWRIEAADGDERLVAAADVATRGTGGQRVPDVDWGLRTLGLRLGGHPGIVAGVLILYLGLFVLTAWRWRLLLRAVDLTLSMVRSTRLTFIGAFFNTAIPGATGGDVVKAYYAAKATGRPTRAVLSVFVDRISGLLGLAVLAGLVLLVAPGEAGYGPARLVVGVVLGVALLGIGVLATPTLRRALGVGRLVGRLPFQALLGEVRAALALYRDRPVALLVALATSVLNHAVASFTVWLLARALGIEGLGLGMALALVPVANLFAAIPLLPGGWGVGELAFAYLFGQVGIPATEAVGLSVVYRLGILAASLPGGVLWFFWKDRPAKEVILQEVDEATHAAEASTA